MPTVTIADWIDYMRAQDHTPATIRTWTTAVRRLCKLRGVADPASISRLDVIVFIGQQKTRWTKITYWSAVRAWAEFVREYADPDFDPLKGFPRPDTPEAVARPISDREVLRLLSAPLRDRTRTYILLALLQGLRVHEIAKIKGDHLDRGAGWLTVLGKGGIEKSIPLHPVISSIAARMPSGYWFPSATAAGHVTGNNVTITIARAMRSVGIDATAHQLRDTFATRIQRQVGDIRVTQTMLRHKSVKSTQKYTAVADEDLQRAVSRLTWEGGEAA